MYLPTVPRYLGNTGTGYCMVVGTYGYCTGTGTVGR